MIRIAAVSYLNTRPFIEGIERTFLPEEIELITDVPSRCIHYFLRNEAEVALVPAGALLDLSRAALLDGYCIGATGRVDSVFLFAQQPVSAIESVFLDDHSRTSNGLAKILFKHFWKKNVDFVQEPNYLDKIQGATAGVVIGDKAVPLAKNYQYVYDLAAEWAAFTQTLPQIGRALPFAFAVWVYQPEKLTAADLSRLQTAFGLGVSLAGEVADKWGEKFGYTPQAALRYFTESIDYRFDAEKQTALRLYLQLLAEIEGVFPPQWVV